VTIDWLSRIAAPVVDLGPGAVDLRAYRGDDFAARFNFRYADDRPVVLAGTWRAQIRRRHDDATPLGTFAVDATEQAVGIVWLRLTAAQTTTLPQRTVWDLEDTAGPGVRTWFSGGLYIGGDVTR
jgi:hypothetical protein